MRRHYGRSRCSRCSRFPSACRSPRTGAPSTCCCRCTQWCAAGALAHLVPRLSPAPTGPWPPEACAYRGQTEARRRRRRPPWRPAVWLEWLLLARSALYAMQALLLERPRQGGREHRVLLRAVRAAVPDPARRAPGRASCCALPRRGGRAGGAVRGVGFVEYYRKALFLNPKVVAADQYDNYFRVNSVFFDPSIYGRFLALVMIAVMTVVLAARTSTAVVLAQARERRRELLAGAAVLAWLLAGLVTSFSQSSIAALLLGLAVLGAWCWGVRPTLYVSGGLLALAAAVVVLAPAEPSFRAQGLERLREQRDERPRDTDRRRSRTVRRTAAQGYGSGLVRNRVQTAQQGLRGERRERYLRLAHDPRDDRRRAGHRRAGAVRSAAAGGVRGALPRRRALAAEDRDRGLLRGARAAHLDIRRFPGGPRESRGIGLRSRRFGVAFS